MELILQITGLLAKGPDPLQYFCGKDNDKKIAAKRINITLFRKNERMPLPLSMTDLFELQPKYWL